VKRRTGAVANSWRLTQTPYNLLGALSAGLLVVAFCLILLWHDPLVFWNDDYELSVLPVFADMARSWSEGHWPILSPYSWVCGNLAGEFQYGTFSLFVNALVVLVWKFPLAFHNRRLHFRSRTFLYSRLAHFCSHAIEGFQPPYPSLSRWLPR